VLLWSPHRIGVRCDLSTQRARQVTPPHTTSLCCSITTPAPSVQGAIGRSAEANLPLLLRDIYANILWRVVAIYEANRRDAHACLKIFADRCDSNSCTQSAVIL
jgi:hypothetical protein